MVVFKFFIVTNYCSSSVKKAAKMNGKLANYENISGQLLLQQTI